MTVHSSAEQKGYDFQFSKKNPKTTSMLVAINEVSFIKIKFLVQVNETVQLTGHLEVCFGLSTDRVSDNCFLEFEYKEKEVISFSFI